VNQLDPEVLATFQEEAAERLATMEDGLLLLEREGGQNPSTMREIFRDAHSLKAAANLLGFRGVELMAHQMENTFDLMRRGSLPVDDGLYTLLLGGVDALRALVGNPGAEPGVAVQDTLRALRALLIRHG
jgi:two-component system chemotaxis sensor kinase CheA